MESSNTGWIEAVVCSHPLLLTQEEVTSIHAQGGPDQGEAHVVVV